MNKKLRKIDAVLSIIMAVITAVPVLYILGVLYNKAHNIDEILLRMPSIFQERVSDIDANRLIELTNTERLLVGLPPLTKNKMLTAAAIMKAKDIADKQYWSHTSPDGLGPYYWFRFIGYDYEEAGENLAEGFEKPEHIHVSWMASETHKKNILEPKFTEIGIAVVYDALEKKDSIIVVQLFGSPKE